MIFGLDTSSAAGAVDPNWSQAKSAGPIGFAIIRATYGDQPDSAFARRWPAIKDAGLVRGAFLFLRFPRQGKSAPDPAAQASALIATVGALESSDLPPAIDVEFPGAGRSETGMTAAECLDWVRACYRIVGGHYGVAPIVYTSLHVWRDELDNLPAPDLAESPLWAVRWVLSQNQPALRDPTQFAGGKSDPAVPAPWGDAWWIHQYQGDAPAFPGFPRTSTWTASTTWRSGRLVIA